MKAPKLRCCPKCGSTDLRLKAVAETTWTFTQMPDGTFERSDITEPDYYDMPIRLPQEGVTDAG